MKYILKIPIIAIFCFFALNTQAQQTYVLSGEPKMAISGTSSLHDWEMISNQAEGSAVLSVADGKVTEIASAKFSMEAKSLKSGRGQMDNNAYKALEADKNPKITFILKEASKNGNSWKINGALQIAGVSRTVAFDLNTETNQGKVTLSGTSSFKLTDFDVDPPTAVFGTIKTGDEVTLNIAMNLKSE